MHSRKYSPDVYAMIINMIHIKDPYETILKNKLRNDKTEDKGGFWENSSWMNQMILLCCFSPFWDLGGCGLGLDRLKRFLCILIWIWRFWENIHRWRQLHLSGESPKHGPNMCSREELLASVSPEPTWDVNRWEVTHSCGKLQTLHLGEEMRGDTLLPVVSSVTHHLLIGVLQVTGAETSAVPSLPCLSSTKETKEVSYVSKGTLHNEFERQAASLKQVGSIKRELLEKMYEWVQI